MEAFNIQKETFRALTVEVPFALAHSSAFMDRGHLTLLATTGYLYRWRVFSESAFESRQIHGCRIPILNIANVVHEGRKVYWSWYSRSELCSFDLDSEALWKQLPFQKPCLALPLIRLDAVERAGGNGVNNSSQRPNAGTRLCSCTPHLLRLRASHLVLQEICSYLPGPCIPVISHGVLYVHYPREGYLKSKVLPYKYCIELMQLAVLSNKWAYAIGGVSELTKVLG